MTKFGGGSGKDSSDSFRSAERTADFFAEASDVLRKDVARLEREITVATSVAVEVLEALADVDRSEAKRVRDELLRQYAVYVNADNFPNLRQLLSSIAAIR